MPKHLFKTCSELSQAIDAYFKKITGEGVEETNNERKASDKTPEPPTLSGFALFLGFDSRQEFEDYEQNKKFGGILKRGRLRIEAEYEKKLHQQASGIVFALKNSGWNEKNDGKVNPEKSIVTLKIKIIEAGPEPANSENEVTL